MFGASVQSPSPGTTTERHFQVTDVTLAGVIASALPLSSPLDTKEGTNMLICTTWKARPLSPEQTDRMMATWGKLEAESAENPHFERLCWYLNADGSGGVTVSKVADETAAHQFGLETALALGEFLELESRSVLDLDSAMPAIMGAVERMKG